MEGDRAARREAFQQELSDLLHDAHAAGAEVWLFTSPVHARLTEVLAVMGFWDDNLQWRRAIHRAWCASPYADRPWLDAAGYSAVTTERIPPPGTPLEGDVMTFFWEGSHATPLAGSLILVTLAGQPDPRVGTLLTRTSDLEAHLSALAAARTAWQAAEPQEAHEVAATMRFLHEHVYDEAATQRAVVEGIPESYYLRTGP